MSINVLLVPTPNIYQKYTLPPSLTKQRNRNTKQFFTSRTIMKYKHIYNNIIIIIIISMFIYFYARETNILDKAQTIYYIIFT